MAKKTKQKIVGEPEMPDFLRRGKLPETTRQVHLIVTNKEGRKLERSFIEVVAAKAYIEELGEPDKTKGTTFRCGKLTVQTNYDLKSILKEVKVDKDLPWIMKNLPDPEDYRRHLEKFPPKKVEAPKSLSVPKAKKANGEEVPLKVLCGELDVDPRKARQRLRRAIRDNRLSHEYSARWAWPKDSDEIEKVKEILNGLK